jgi:hypothetical protein
MTMKKILFVYALIFSLFSASSISAKEEYIIEEEIDNSIVIDRIGNNDIEVTLPSTIFTFSDVDVHLKFRNPNHTKLLLNKNKVEFIIDGESRVLTFVNGEASFTKRFDNGSTLTILTEEFSYRTKVTAYPVWVILIPAFLILAWLISRAIKKRTK